jgi:subtilisin family serine protease
MRIARRAAFLGCCLAWVHASVLAQPEQSDARILVMFALAPAHFRPDVDYPGGYDASADQESRKRTARDVAQAYGLNMVDDWPMPALGVACFVMAVAPGTSIETKLEQLRGDRRVESAQAMNQFRGLGRGDPLAPMQPASTLWHLARLHEFADGRGVSVAQLDSGVDRSHPDLSEQDIRVEDFVGGELDGGEAHGTEVAGIIVAGTGNGVGIAGIAPGARLLALRACWQVQERSSLCNSFTLAKALQFAIDRKVRIINLSLTGPADRLLERLLEVAWRRDIAVVAAADPDASDGGFPASSDHVLAVGMEGPMDVGTPGKADAWAPGRDVPTTTTGGRWEFVSGSSFAAAHVSGLLALMLELSPAWKPQELVSALRPEGAQAVSASRRPRLGPIDACLALSRAAGAPSICREEGTPRVVSSH